jgi:pimeloyl-ACP methyl ester carboxylesterase
MLLFDQGLQDELASEVVDVWRFAKARLNSVSGRRVAAKRFIEYWSGEGAWDFVPVKRQRRFASLMPKVVAEFDAILSSGTSIADLAGLNIPVRLIHGDQTRKTAARVIEVLSQTLPDVENILVEGAAHMAPTTHASRIDPLFAEHVLACLNNSLRVAA